MAGSTQPNLEFENQNASIEHHRFIVRTDRKSLFNQIKGLVSKAQEVANDELLQRRIALSKLLEYDDKIYEEEFATKVKSRIDEDIKKRNYALLKIKEENSKNAREFLASKSIQQYMNSCYEIREALRHKERQNVKECQLEQIVERERSIRRAQNNDQYWLKIQQMNLMAENSRQSAEDCLKQKLAMQNKNVLDLQMEDKAARLAEEQKVKATEVKELNKVLEEIRLEEFDRKVKGPSVKAIQYRNELLSEINAKRTRRRLEECERAREHRKMIDDLQKLEAAERSEAVARKRDCHKATMDYISYVRRMRQLENDQKNKLDDRIDDLQCVDVCTKHNIQQELQRKAKIAQAYYAELRRQMCEASEKSLREEVERRECKIIENRFARQEMTYAELLEQRRKNRLELDKQVATLRRVRSEEEDKYNKELLRASDDPVFCATLAEQYIKEGVDYLEPHANWRILSCPVKEYVAKKPLANVDEPPEGSPCVQAVVPCGCDARANIECGLTSSADQGDRIKY